MADPFAYTSGVTRFTGTSPSSVGSSMPLPFLAAAAPSIISGIAGLFGASSASKQAAKAREEQQRQFNAELAQNQAQYQQTYGLNSRVADTNRQAGNRAFVSSQDDKRRVIGDQAYLNPDRKQMLALLMQKFGSRPASPLMGV